MTLSEATEQVKSLAEKHAGKFGNKVNFLFSEDEIIHLDDTVSPAQVANEKQDAPCDIKITLENFDKMLGGNLNPMMAFMMGKMKIDGDKGVAMKLASLF
jgi:putative sterol carrier protein